MSAPTITAQTLAKLAQFDTPTICNVIELFDVRPNDVGYMDRRIQSAFPEIPPMVGFASTASLRSIGGSGGNAYVTLDVQVQHFETLPGPAVVVFQDLDDPAVGATFGEVMCSTYKAFGSVGLITSGGGRDLLQVKALNFPVFSASTICSHAYCRTIEVGKPVRVGGLVVNSGDLLHGDANGVTNIPVNLATEIADVAEDYIAAENHVLHYVKAEGPKQASELAARYRALAEAISVLRKRVARK